MSQFPEYLQIRAPAGTAKALEDAAAREGKRPAQIVREALTARLADTAQAA
ncbi:CopG family transcriptional regulator [Aureimonas leprariae]|uniref:CopG family transcriptional regulator n=1 Tax=Plantimonas leprariae TaxID=2615207 RepID=A0A7V7PPW3_9HYPH|nr:CopG family transcriptional regulator [Aureimonas leprariae]